MRKRPAAFSGQRGTCGPRVVNSAEFTPGVLPFCSAHGPKGRTLRKTKGDFSDVHAAGKIVENEFLINENREAKKLRGFAYLLNSVEADELVVGGAEA